MPSEDQRRDFRYPLSVEAVLERESGETIHAVTVNVSGGGLLLNLDGGARLDLGEAVTCGVRLYEGKPVQSWGCGRVVRVDQTLIAIDFRDM